jgi:hypothetical protein
MSVLGERGKSGIRRKTRHRAVGRQVKTIAKAVARNHLEVIFLGAEEWTIERVYKDVSEARTKIFVVAKFLETGSLKLAEHSEWALLLRPLLKDLAEHTESIRKLAEGETSSPSTDSK